jgi:two pore calcium channel protein
MIMFILLFVIYYAWIGNWIFAGQIEGTESFNGSFNSFWSVFVCLTTSNYPDVMLPAYKNSRFLFFFFFSFLVLGLFLFMNMLLAIFYTAYQDKSTQIIEKYDNKRNTYLNKLYTSL